MTDRLIILCCALTMSWNHGTGQDDWSLKKEKDGIRVYVRETDKSGFDEFKAETTCDFSIDALLNVMWDVDRYDQWISEVKSAEMLKKSGDTAQIYYSVIEVPFPFQDRDVIYYNTFQRDNSHNRLTITIKGLPDYLDKKDDFVRMPYGKGHWTADSIGPGRIKVTLQMLVDPGGNLPSWLVNNFIADSPYRTLKNLKEFGKKEKYKSR